MFRSIFRPSSGVRFCVLRNYCLSARMLCLVPVCGGILSVCVYLRRTCRSTHPDTTPTSTVHIYTNR